MDRQLSDEQIERIAKNLLDDFALDPAALDEIADAPQLWWNVRSRIEAEGVRRKKNRFEWLRAPRPAFGAAALLIGGALAFFVFNPARSSNQSAALEKPVENRSRQIAQISEAPQAVSPEADLKTPESTQRQLTAKAPLKTAARQNAFVAKNKKDENSAKPTPRSAKNQTAPAAALEETKTDFIALSYAANTESGQIVRVKVPSSMMVTLGVKTEVGDAGELVNAEVVIGDDGLARAIRFIR